MKDRIKKLKKLKELKELELELICAELEKLLEEHSKIKEEKKEKEENFSNNSNSEEVVIEDTLYTIEEVIEEKVLEEKPKVNKYAKDLVYDIKDYPRYLKNGKNQIFHETGIEIPQFEKDGKMWVKVFNRSNELVEVEVDKL